MKKTFASMVLMSALLPCLALAGDPDPFLWLEEIESPKVIAWVKEQNARSTKELEAAKDYQPIFEKTLNILDSKERIPYPAFHGEFVYNLWQDNEHERGIWRRTTLASYRTSSPQWETVIDVDALTKQDGIPWAFRGSRFLEPSNRRCLVSLSRGGGDAVVVREFDTQTKTFVKDGFMLPEAKSSVDWYDENTIWVGTDFGKDSLTTAGYPRIVKLWKRGTPLSEAQTIFEGKPGDVSVAGNTIVDVPEGRTYYVVNRSPVYFKQETFLRLGERLVKLEIPEDANVAGFFQDRLMVSLRTPWTVGGRTFPAGGLLAIGLDDFLKGSRAFEVLFEPSAKISYQSLTTTRSRILLSTIDNVRSRIHSLTPTKDGWKREELVLPGMGTAGVVSVDREKDLFFYTYNDLLTPISLFLNDGTTSEKLKRQPAYFDATGMTVEQFEATSKDGTKVPYFVVLPKGFKADGTAPTLQYGYGGFEVPELPRYGRAKEYVWLDRGGVFVLANIRGGGEFGPTWHEVAKQKNRIKAVEDFIAVSEDLIARKITSKEHLGIKGGSQGGLLVGSSFTLRPDLYKAVISAIPLADMQRYHKLLAGASWMAEYGDPDKPEDWAYIQTWSPYHLLRKDAKYPKVFFWTTTRDDRVHPAHARKMTARMMELGHPVLYFENMEGGHGSGTTNKQQAHVIALEYTYLWKMLR